MKTSYWQTRAFALSVAAGVFVLGFLAVYRPTLVLLVPASFLAGLALFAIPRDRVLPVSLVLALAIVVFLTPGQFGPGLISLLFPPVGAFSLCLFGLRRSLKAVRYPPGFSLLCAVFSVAMVATVIYPSTQIYYAMTALVGLTVLVAAASVDTRGVRVVRLGVVAIGVMLSLLGFLERFVLGEALVGNYAVSLGNNTIVGGVRAQATLGAPVVLGFVIMLSLIVLVSSGLFGTFARVVVVFVLLVGIMTSGTASALVVAVIMIPGAIFLRLGLRSKLSAIVTAAFGWLFIFGFSVLPQGILDGVFSKLEGQNAVHRSNSWKAIPNLFSDQSVDHILIGNGWGSARALYRSGVLIEDGFYAIDNQFAWSISVFGVIGAAFLVAFLVVVFVRGDAVVRSVLVGSVIMGFSFDFFAWVSSLAVILCVVGLGSMNRVDDVNGDGASDKLEAIDESQNAVKA